MLSKDYLCAVVKEPDAPNGKLNPQWVEWLMGYPTDHTELRPLETASSPHPEILGWAVWWRFFRKNVK